MAKYMLFKNNLVENLIEYDGVSSYTPPEGCTLHVFQDGAQIGMSVVDGIVQIPEPEPEPEPE